MPPYARTSTSYALALVPLALVGFGACRQNVTPAAEASVAVATPTRGTAATTAPAGRPDGWDAYWYSGKAELNTYRTVQNRYGEDRPGTAVLIFVTEPFLPETQVKDDGAGSNETSISVLKLNRIERFETGIYDYSIMQSVFTPVSRGEYPHTLKTTTSVQDWCGQVWAQYNLRDDEYVVEQRSYFQREADATYEVDATWLEDELLNVARLDPRLLPSGKTRVIPSEKYGRLFHVDTRPQAAVVGFGESPTGLTLTVDFPASERRLEYRFAPTFPHRVEGWTETVKGVTMMTAERTATRQEAYWSQNKNAYAGMRDSLGLE